MCDERAEKVSQVHTFIVDIILRSELGEGGGWRERGRTGVFFQHKAVVNGVLFQHRAVVT